MSRENRAKQFLPFAALRGLNEALREAERVVMPRAVLFEEEMERVDRMLRQVRVGQRVWAVCYRDGAYMTVCGAVERVETGGRVLQIDGVGVRFEDLRTLEICVEKEQG